jgi:hypothetical protein
MSCRNRLEALRWNAIDRRRKIKEDSRGSSETSWPIEERKSQPLWLIGPKVSKESDKKIYEISTYLSSFGEAAASADESAMEDIVCKQDATMVSVIVTSHVAHRLSLNGIRF